MEPYLEEVRIPDFQLPIRAWISTGKKNKIQVHPHWHDEIELLYFLEGNAIQQVNGYFFSAVKGDIVIIGSDDIHSTYTNNDSNAKILVLQFDARLLYTGVAAYDRDKVTMLKRKIRYPLPVKPDSEPGTRITQCMGDILNEITQKQEAFDYIIRSDVFELAGVLLRYYSHLAGECTNELPIKATRNMLRNTFRLIDENFTGNITLKQAASASSMSVPHFCRLFKKATGMTFKDYLARYRINRAEELFATSQSITEIALESGFENINSFTRYFKKYKQCTPSSYRSKLL